jgi:hypothetical protein
MGSQRKTLIIQTSPYHTGSTLLVNMLYGFLCKDLAIHWCNVTEIKKFDEDFKIIKSHIIDIDSITRELSNDFELYFICSERDSKKIDAKYYHYKNVLVFDYSELLETKDNSVASIVNNAHQKLIKFLPKHLVLSNVDAFNRITDMNKLYEQIKDYPFSYIDEFYQIHGSHRDRVNDC